MPEEVFFVTFGQRCILRDRFVKVAAVDYQAARNFVIYHLGFNFSMIYRADGFEPKFYPGGEIDIENAKPNAITGGRE